MKSTPVQKQEVLSIPAKKRQILFEKLRALLLTWQLYPLLLLTVFLRLYHIDTTSFNDDEANVFRFAREAITHGFLPLTSNPSSVGTMNPPLMIYLTMIPAAFSSNPFWAEVLVGSCNVLAVLLTYFFVDHYYGRLTASIAAFLYATSVVAISYSRFIWPQNFLPFFTVLFLMAIFRGVIEQRKGWLAPALVLVGIQYQLHGSGIFLLIPLGLAVLFAWRTIRLRDILGAVIGLTLLFAPFIFWEFKSHFSDIRMLLNTNKLSPSIDTLSLEYYLHLLSPYVRDVMVQTEALPTYPGSLLASPFFSNFSLFLRLVHKGMPALFICALLFSIIQVILPLHSHRSADTRHRLQSLFNWWRAFSGNSYRQGLILILSWQIIPLVALVRHSITLYPHYFIIFLPGQFILIALFLSRVIDLTRRFRPAWGALTRYGIYALAITIIGAQFLGSLGYVVDNARGNFDGYGDSVHYFNDLTSLRRATTAADQLAQQNHIGRIYISSVFVLNTSMTYLAEQMHTPATVFEASECFLLPNPSAGPVVFLSEPNNPADSAFIAQYTYATLIQELPRLSGPPFKLYILTAKLVPTVAQQSFSTELQLLSPGATAVPSALDNQQWLTTRWQITNALNPDLRTKYKYAFQLQARADSSWSATPQCWATRLWAGDQLFAFHEMTKDTSLPASLTVQVTSSREVPIHYTSFGLTLLSYKTQNIEQRSLRTANGQESLILSIHANIESSTGPQAQNNTRYP